MIEANQRDDPACGHRAERADAVPPRHGSDAGRRERDQQEREYDFVRIGRKLVLQHAPCEKRRHQHHQADDAGAEQHGITENARRTRPAQEARERSSAERGERHQHEHHVGGEIRGRQLEKYQIGSQPDPQEQSRVGRALAAAAHAVAQHPRKEHAPRQHQQRREGDQRSERIGMPVVEIHIEETDQAVVAQQPRCVTGIARCGQDCPGVCAEAAAGMAPASASAAASLAR